MSAQQTSNTPPSVKAKRALSWYQNSRLARTLKRYSFADGTVLAGGIAYSALFSIFAGLAIGWTVFMAVLGDNDALRESVLDEMDNFAPGIVDTGDGDGVIKPDDLIMDRTFSLASVIAVAVLIFSATKFMNATRVAVRLMFGMEREVENFVKAKTKDVVGLLTFGLAILASAAASVIIGTATGWLLGLFGWEDTDAGRLVIKALGFIAVLIIDAFTLILLMRVAAGAKPPKWDLIYGSLAGALGIGILKVLGTSAVGGSSDPLTASFAVIITLLLWVNFMARIMLYAAAWTANPPLPNDTDQLVSYIPARD